MPTIDEIFAALPEEPAQDAHEFLVIDPATRTITVPKAESIFGVEADTLSERKYFICPRYVGDNLDLAACFLSIKYRNANGEKDEYLVEDTAINGEYVTFSWLLSSKVVAYKGPVQFRFYADTGAGKDWGTTLAQGTSLEGMETDNTTVEAETSDVVAQLRAMVTAQTAAVEAAGAAQVAAVKAQGTTSTQEAVAAIQAQGEVTNASIPAEYTELEATVDQLARDRAAAIVCEAEGELLQITDASNDPLQGLRIFGRTEQHVTTGAQMFDAETAVYGMLETDGTIVTETAYMTSDFIPVQPGTTYHQTKKESIRAKYYDADKVALSDTWDIQLVEAGTFTTPANAYYLRITVSTPLVATFMLNAGTEALPWEAYSGGVAAPCPDWPMELQSRPAPVVSVCGKNLVDVTAMELAANKSLTISDDGYTVTVVGGSDKTYAYSHYDMPESIVHQLRGKTVRLSSDSVAKSLETAYSPVQLNLKTAGGMFLYPVNTDTKLVHEFTVPEDTVEIRFGVYTNNTANLLAEDNTVVVKGVRLTLANAAEYEAYKPIQTLELQNELPGVPVTSGGNYTDADGQEWVCDEVDLARGVYVQRVQSVTFDGTETWTLGDYNGVKYLLFPLSVPGITSGIAGDMCTHAARATWPAVSSLKGDDFFVSPHAFFSPSQGGVNYTSADDWAAYLAAQYAAGNPVKILYMRAAPVETALTDVELQTFLALRSNKPTTTVLNDAGANMLLEYAADPKTYIDNKLAALIAANS